MISITISGTERVQGVLEKLRQINNIVALWMKSGNPDQIMQQSFAENFKKEGRPAWEPLADETMIARVNEGFSAGPILIRTGNLKDEVTTLRGKVSTKFNSSEMVWGIEQVRDKTKFYAHQKGKGKSGQRLPKRQMIGFQTQDGKRMVNDLRNWILKAL